MPVDTTAIRDQLEADLQSLLARVETIDNRLRQPGEQDWEEQATQRENDEVLKPLDKQTAEEIEGIKQALHKDRDPRRAEHAHPLRPCDRLSSVP